MKRLSLVNSFLLLLILVGVVYMYFNRPVDPVQIRYVDNRILFQEFSLSKDLKTLHTKKIKQQAKLVDSLYVDFQESIQKKLKKNSLELKQAKFQEENQHLQEYQEYFGTKVTQQVWERLNAYIKEFGANNNYDILIGTQGNGTVMYGAIEYDITQELLEFCNDKYEGQNANK